MVAVSKSAPPAFVPLQGSAVHYSDIWALRQLIVAGDVIIALVTTRENRVAVKVFSLATLTWTTQIECVHGSFLTESMERQRMYLLDDYTLVVRVWLDDWMRCIEYRTIITSTSKKDFSGLAIVQTDTVEGPSTSYERWDEEDANPEGICATSADGCFSVRAVNRPAGYNYCHLQMRINKPPSLHHLSLLSVSKSLVPTTRTQAYFDEINSSERLIELCCGFRETTRLRKIHQRLGDIPRDLDIQKDEPFSVVPFHRFILFGLIFYTVYVIILFIACPIVLLCDSSIVRRICRASNP